MRYNFYRDQALLEKVGLPPTTHGLKMNKDLNPDIWDKNRKMKPHIRQHLLKVVRGFLAFSKIDLQTYPISDINISGSNANYNYSGKSDLDVHIQLNTHGEALIRDMIYTKTVLWKKLRKIKALGLPIEVFVEHEEQPKPAGGVYSLIKNTWLSPPVRFTFDRKDMRIRKLALTMCQRINAALKTNDFQTILACNQDILKARRTILNANPGSVEGETNPYNLAYRLVRSMGYLDKMNERMNSLRNQELTLDRKGANRYMKPEELIDPQMLIKPKPPAAATASVEVAYLYHNKLNPKLFGKDAMLKADVKAKLLQIVNTYEQFMNVKMTKHEILFKGSNANFNYHKGSDIDVHIIATLKNPADRIIIQAKQIAWKQRYKDIRVMGFPVELSIDPLDQVHTSDGQYSLTKNDWIKKPKYSKPKVDKKAANALKTAWMKQLTEAIKTGDIDKMLKVRGQIIGIRNKSLDGSPGAEWKVQNVAYKAVRDTGILEDILDRAHARKIKNLSLVETKPWRKWLNKCKEIWNQKLRVVMPKEEPVGEPIPAKVD